MSENQAANTKKNKVLLKHCFYFIHYVTQVNMKYVCPCVTAVQMHFYDRLKVKLQCLDQTVWDSGLNTAWVDYTF